MDPLVQHNFSWKRTVNEHDVRKKDYTLVEDKFARKDYTSIEPIAPQPVTFFVAYYSAAPPLTFRFKAWIFTLKKKPQTKFTTFPLEILRFYDLHLKIKKRKNPLIPTNKKRGLTGKVRRKEATYQRKKKKKDKLDDFLRRNETHFFFVIKNGRAN